MSTITRDSNFPKEIAELMAIMSACAGGYTVDQVLNAVVHLTVNAIMTKAAMSKLSLEETLSAAEEHVFDNMREAIRENYQRAPKPSDVKVGPTQ